MSKWCVGFSKRRPVFIAKARTQPSRVHANFQLDVYDWDRVGTADKLGRGKIDLADLEPMQQFPLKVQLTDPHSDAQQGVVNLRMIFRPGFIIRSRQATSTMVGRTGTAIGGGVLQVGSGVGHVGVGAVKGVGKIGYTGVTGVGKLGYSGVRKVVPGHHKRTGTASTIDPDGNVDGEEGAVAAIVPSTDAAQANGQAGGGGFGSAGKLSVAVLGASGLPDAEHKTFVSVRLNGRKVDHTKTSHQPETPTWDETFSTETGDGQAELEFTVFVPKTIGKDKELGRATANVFEHLQPAVGVLEADLNLPLSGGAGELKARISLQPKEGGDHDREPSVAGSSPATRKISNVFGRGREKTPA